MNIKNPNEFSRWRFYCEAPDGDEIKLPLDNEYSPNLQSLQEIVFAQFKEFGQEYTTSIEIEAAKLNLGYSVYVKKSIEHQICLRENNPKLCWNNGFGDEIHSTLASVDRAIDSSPAIIKEAARSVVKAMTKLATGSAKPRFQGCTFCGGTKTFAPTQANLGRAGALNNYVPTTLRRNQRY